MIIQTATEIFPLQIKLFCGWLFSCWGKIWVQTVVLVDCSSASGEF